MSAAPRQAGRPRHTLPKAMRLATQREFRAVYQRGARASGAWFTVVARLPRPGEAGAPTAPRLGLSVSKDHGGAVRRNKLKRLLREAFRLERHRLPAIDLVLIPRQRPDRYPLAELRTELVALVQQLANRPHPGPRGRPRRDHRPPSGGHDRPGRTP